MSTMKCYAILSMRKSSVLEKLPKHRVGETNSPKLYLADYKDFNGGPVVISEAELADIRYVHVENPNLVSIYYDCFEENALEVEIGKYSRQCECVLFPCTEADSDWVLFVEMKYANDFANAFREARNYPFNMIDQIIKTVSFFRDKEILDPKKRASAIVSFPNLVQEFNSTFFSGQLSELDILKEHNILIRATNSARIISQKRLTLNAV